MAREALRDKGLNVGNMSPTWHGRYA